MDDRNLHYLILDNSDQVLDSYWYTLEKAEERLEKVSVKEWCFHIQVCVPQIGSKEGVYWYSPLRNI